MPDIPGAPGEDHSPALALVNTELEPRGRRVDLIGDAEAAGRWLSARGLAPAGTTLRHGDVDAVHALRAATRALFASVIAGTAAAPTALAAVNASARRAPGAPQLAWADDGPEADWLPAPGAGPLDTALASLAADAIDVLTGPRAATLRACQAHGCVRLFLQDHGRRHWCSRTCGDRVRVARHYEKTRAQRG